MKRSIIKSKTIISSLVIILLLSFCLSNVSNAKTLLFKWTNVKQIEVTAYELNVRLGPSTSYRKIGMISRGDIIDVLGTLGSWYVIHMKDGSVGVISSTYTRVYSYYNPAPTTKEPDKYSGNLSPEETLMINLVNAERKSAGLPAYKLDMELMRVARIKAEDISTNKYFSHDSPIYGSPFKMLSDFSVDYKMAAENIAGDTTVETAQQSLMNSSSHKSNILSTDYNYIGIGIVDDSRYGKVFVQMFIQK
ncbi:hypothetical protein SH1V18_11780 [Vallitalea longa]|uniref:SH3b domain-containing protein n=1 Tax=Vallitalea longa TaxID=2936439 RepID=A0A9W6DEQ8_9FIRM|nr:CAP domain-containing protein [Vallitalea longa]GKX28698.1 hypothetical protein SH1V18_11780 [Vallitalea longa]